jgi:hypothetical protein
MGLGFFGSRNAIPAEPMKNIAASVMELMSVPGQGSGVRCQGSEGAANIATNIALYLNVGRLIWHRCEKK